MLFGSPFTTTKERTPAPFEPNPNEGFASRDLRFLVDLFRNLSENQCVSHKKKVSIFVNVRYNRDMTDSIQNDILQLPPDQQLAIAEFIYSSLASRGQLLTQEQLQETKRRAQQAREEPGSTLTTKQLWEQVENLKNERNN